MTDLTMASGLQAPARSRNAITGWMLFDWAVQPFHTLILTFFFARYFAAEVVDNSAEAQTLWGVMLALTGVTIAVLSPILGAVADAIGPRKPWIGAFMVPYFAGALLLWLAVPSAGGAVVLLTLLAIAMLMVGYEFAAVFNNAMMTDLVPRERLGRLSGSAWALGYAGGVVALLIMLVLVSESSPGSGRTLVGLTPIFGLSDVPGGGNRFTGPFTAVWMLLFVWPMFLYTPDRTRVGGPVRPAVRKALADLKQSILHLPKRRSFFAYLGSSMFYRDALNGLYAFGGVYAGGVLEWSATKLGVFGLIAAITGAFGAYVGGRLDDRLGPKPVVAGSVIGLATVSLAIVLTDRTSIAGIEVAPVGSDILFYVCGAVIGALGGTLQAASRTLLADQAEPGRIAEAFGLYALSGKATSFLAPALIALMTGPVALGLLGLAEDDAQRLGISPIVLLFVIGLALLPMVKARK